MSRKRSKKKLSNSDFDETFDAFLKESVSSEESSLDTARVSKYLNKKKNEPKQWWAREDDEDDDGVDIGLTGTGKNFLKKKQTPQPSFTKGKDEPKRVQFSDSAGPDVGMSRDSLDDESFGVRGDDGRPASGIPALSLGSTSYTDTATADKGRDSSFAPGRDTLEEMADKEQFFNDLEKNSDSTVDYSQLNRDIDSSTIMRTGARQRYLQSHDDDDEDGDDDDRDEVTARRVGNNSEDGGDNEAGLLGKVALVDSLDSTLGTKPAGSRETDMQTILEGTREHEDGVDGHTDTEGIHVTDNTNKKSATGGFGYTDTSREIEALHNALKNVGLSTMDDTRYMTLKDSSTIIDKSPEGTGETGTQQPGGFGLKGLAPKSSTDRTINDLMKEVDEGTDEPDERGFDLQPAIVEDDSGESRGFHLSPATTTEVNGILASRDNQSEGYDLSPEDEVAPDLAESRGFDLAPASPKHSTRSTGPVPAKRTKKTAQVEDKKTKLNKFQNVRGSGYGQTSPYRPKSSGALDTSSWSPAEIQKQKIKGTGELQKKKKNEGNSGAAVEDTHLMSSIHSFANYIQSQFVSSTDPQPPQKNTQKQVNSSPNLKWTQEDSSQRLGALERENNLMKEMSEWQEQWREEKKKLAKTQVEQARMEREYASKFEQMKLGYEQQLFKLKQDNYVLSAKVENAEADKSQRRKILDGSSSEDINKEQVLMMEKEIQEQEKLLAGYQQENERLYEEIKKMQADAKQTEDKLFKDNLKLQNDVASLREHLSMKEVEYQNKGAITSLEVQQQIAAGNVAGTAVLGAGKIANLGAELKQARNREFGLKQDVDMLLKDKKELEQHLQDLVTKLEETAKRLQESKSGQSQEMKVLQSKHEKEIERFNRKLKWYAENQDLLDKDAIKIRDKEEEIKKLKMKLEDLTSDTGKKQAEMKLRQKERTVDGRKIQDLERQVKEMEGIIRKRHPNSLPVLMWAASNSPDPQPASRSAQFLENIIKKLEGQLEEKDEEGKRSIRVLEQKYNSMKFQYEERIDGLESRLAVHVRADDRNLREGEHPHTHVVALQRELDSVKERHRNRVAELEVELDRNKKELVSLKSKDSAVKVEESKLAGDAREVSGRIKALQLEVKNQERDKELLNNNIDKLQREKQQLLIDLSRQSGKNAKVSASANRKLLNAQKTFVRGRGGHRSSPREEPEADDLPPYTDTLNRNKEYQPDTFAGQHVSDIIHENEQLKVTLDRLQLDSEHHRVTVHKLMAEMEGKERRSREGVEEQVAALRGAHQDELQRLMAEHAMQHSTSRVAQLQGQLDTQEVMVKHMKDQLGQAHEDRERVSVLTVREASMETKLHQLAEDLTEAKKSHTPEMRHFEALLAKIGEMESRHARREQDLQQIIQQGRAAAGTELAREVEKWKLVVEAKNRETEKFRTELDAILEVLKELQRQGVVLPYRAAGLSHR